MNKNKSTNISKNNNSNNNCKISAINKNIGKKYCINQTYSK